MIDLSDARALVARARENTADGLTAREALPEIVVRLANALEADQADSRAEWATRQRWPSDGSEEITSPVGEELARRRMLLFPRMHVALLRRTVTFGPWVEVAE